MINTVLAMIPQISLVIFVVVIVPLIVWAIISMKKSRKIDKLTKNLFGDDEATSVDDYINSIKNGKDGLKNESKKIASDIKDKLKDRDKIDKNL